MCEIKTCINVFSDLNPQIDFCIVFAANDYVTNKAKKSIAKAYDDWFESETDEPIADFISNRLTTEVGLIHEIYFKNNEN